MAFSGSQITRLGLSGIQTGLTGSFAGKAASSGAEDVVVATGGGIGKRRKRAYAGYPRRILLNGTLYTVQSPEEERRLLESFIERESAQVANDAAAGRVEKAKKRRLVVRRAERRIDALADREAEHVRRLHDEDDEILTLIAGSGWLH